jgi:hypothetical protein
MHGQGARGEHGTEWERLGSARLGPARRHPPCRSTVQLAPQRAHYCAGGGGGGIARARGRRHTRERARLAVAADARGHGGTCRLKVDGAGCGSEGRTRTPLSATTWRNVAPLTGPHHWAARLSSALRGPDGGLPSFAPVCWGARRVWLSTQRARRRKRNSHPLTATCLPPVAT